jgi:NAD(P)-dependent dehydrogenase (short-subunit alcohol dehydrogenase family)
MVSLAGRSCVVTGAGRGIGRAEALELAARGAKVVVNDFDSDAADSVLAEVVAAGGTAVASYDTVATRAGGAAIIDTALESFGAIDVVVNNAGLRRHRYFSELSAEDIDIVLDSHLKAAFFVTQPAWPHMLRQGFGRVVMTSSSSGLLSNHSMANYAAAKAGLYGLTKALAYEGAEHGIRVNAILPIATTKAAMKVDFPDIVERLAGVSAARQDPDLVAPLVAYLCSPECAINGEAISALYGRFARVFVGVSEGWLAQEVGEVSAENIATHLDEIRDVTRSEVPMWIFDEWHRVFDQLDRIG